MISPFTAPAAPAVRCTNEDGSCPSSSVLKHPGSQVALWLPVCYYGLAAHVGWAFGQDGSCSLDCAAVDVWLMKCGFAGPIRGDFLGIADAVYSWRTASTLKLGFPGTNPSTY
jgi:hypothetical protein